MAVASRVLNGDETVRVTSETKARVLKAAQALAYQPNHRARALRLSRTGAIAMVVPSASNMIFADIYAGVRDVCVGRGLSIFLCQIQRPAVPERQLVDLVGAGQVDAVLLQRSDLFDDDQLAALVSVGIPVLLVNSSLPGHQGSLALDDAAAVAMAVEHLRGLGHQRLALIGGLATHDAAVRRRVAFDDLVQGDPSVVEEAGWEATDGSVAMRRLLSSPVRPTGVITASANAALGALHAAQEAGLRVPDDISIVAIHDTWVCAFTTPGITCVAMPLTQLGRTAATLLLDCLDGATLPNSTLTDPPPRLVVRGSTAPPSA